MQGIKTSDNLSPTFQEYYDDMAEDYETVVRAWGYNCPEVKIKHMIDNISILTPLFQSLLPTKFTSIFPT